MWNRTLVEHDFVANTPRTIVPTPDRVVELERLGDVLHPVAPRQTVEVH
jgi:hypothetical protein